MRKTWLQRTALLLFATIAFCAVGAECRASAGAGAAPGPAPCHGSAPAAPGPAPHGPPCGSVSPLPCCDAPWSLSSGTASEPPPPPLVAIVAVAPTRAPLPALAKHRPPVLARAAPSLALDTNLRL